LQKIKQISKNKVILSDRGKISGDSIDATCSGSDKFLRDREKMLFFKVDMLRTRTALIPWFVPYT
jgi:hypothetical protein